MLPSHPTHSHFFLSHFLLLRVLASSTYVLAAAYMSLITDDPNDSPRDCATKHHHTSSSARRRRRALLAAASSLASLVSLAIILCLTLRPSAPRFTLMAATATVLPNTTVLVVDAALTAYNPNARAAALYDCLQARASYGAGLQLTGAAPIPPFDQPEGDVVLSASLSSSSPVANAGGGRAALLRLHIEGQLRWKVASWVSARHDFSVDCIAVLLLQPSPPSSLQLRAVVLGAVVQGSRCDTTLE